MEMRERIARAICGACDCEGRLDWWNEYLAAADAVLAAMREPTEEMMRACTGEGAAAKIFISDRFVCPVGAWQAMIDAAMSPPSDWIPGGMVVPARLEE